MFAVLRNRRKPLLRCAAVLSALWLAACGPMQTAGTGFGSRTDGPVPVALLLPSGSGDPGEETLARSLRQAAELAIADLDGVEIDLRIYNTGGSAALAGQMASRAVDEGAQIILGPLHAAAANAAGVAVAPRGVNVLAFSNNADIAGGNVFVLGATFGNTASRLVRYATRQGITRIALVHEETQAGEVGARAIEAAVANSGATITGRVSYPFSQQDLIAAVPRIAQTVQANEAEAIFMTADTAGALPLLTQLLPEQGVGNEVAQYIGLTRWDVPNATLALPGVQGGWFALPDPNLNQQFRSRFQAAYGELPHPIAGVAYDGIAAIGALARSGRADALSRAALTQGSGFVGVSGVFRFRPDGSNERALAVAEVRNQQVVVIDPAPRSFGGAGF